MERKVDMGRTSYGVERIEDVNQFGRATMKVRPAINGGVRAKCVWDLDRLPTK